MKRIESNLLCDVTGGSNPSGACIVSMLTYGAVMISGAGLTAASGGLAVFGYFAGLGLAAYDMAYKCN